MYSEVNVVHVKAYCFDLIEMKLDLFLEHRCLARDQNLPKSTICQHDSTQGWKSDESKINKPLDFVKKVLILRHLSRSVANKQIKRESASFCLNPYFIVIEGTGVKMTFHARVNITLRRML